MCPPPDRFSLLEARRSAYAAEYLRDLRMHHAFPEIMSKLERIPGPIYRLDIEQAHFETTKQDETAKD